MAQSERIKPLGRLLRRDFFEAPPERVARLLLGKILVQKKKGRRPIAGRIVEVEAYLGPHRRLADPAAHSHRGQWQIITGFYQWCRARGIYLNVPDWYYLAGLRKCGMGYRESNWSLPRDQQEIIERQNIYDGTWEKTPSMGWMFVPLTEYQGAAAP